VSDRQGGKIMSDNNTVTSVFDSNFSSSINDRRIVLSEERREIRKEINNLKRLSTSIKDLLSSEDKELFEKRLQVILKIKELNKLEKVCAEKLRKMKKLDQAYVKCANHYF